MAGIWDRVRVFGTYDLGLDEAGDPIPAAGSVTFTFTARVVHDDGTTKRIYPPTRSYTVDLDPATGLVERMCPAVDDPDITPNDWWIRVTENITDRAQTTYLIQPKMADVAEGFDLAQVVVPGTATPQPAYPRGVAGGVAGLDEDGDVVNAAGQKIGAVGSTVVVFRQQADGSYSEGEARIFLGTTAPSSVPEEEGVADVFLLAEPEA